MRIKVYQWTAAGGRTSYSWYLDDKVSHKDAAELADTICNTGEDIVDVTIDIDGTVTHSVTGKHDSF